MLSPKTSIILLGKMSFMDIINLISQNNTKEFIIQFLLSYLE